MKCPKCSAAMEQVIYSGHEIDRCTTCKGLWMQVPEFEALVGDDWLAEFIDPGSRTDRRKAPKLEAVKCLDCGSVMDQVVDANQAHIVYERCPKDCGVFFDAGEFKDLTKKTFWDRFKLRPKTA